jgi:hypothetical protein
MLLYIISKINKNMERYEKNMNAIDAEFPELNILREEYSYMNDYTHPCVYILYAFIMILIGTGFYNIEGYRLDLPGSCTVKDGKILRNQTHFRRSWIENFIK